jgi:hypothetical protein
MKMVSVWGDLWVMTSLTCYQSTAGLELVLDNANDDFMFNEIEKQKTKLKDMSKMIEQQHQLLRLIVQVNRLCLVLNFINPS